MNNSLVMRGSQAVGNLNGVVNNSARMQRAVTQAITNRNALQKFAHQVWNAIRRAHVIDGEDVGVIESASGPRFLFKPAQAVGIAAEGARQDLDGNVPAQSRVAGPIHLTHAALTKWGDDLVGAEFGAGNKGHSWA